MDFFDMYYFTLLFFCQNNIFKKLKFKRFNLRDGFLILNY